MSIFSERLKEERLYNKLTRKELAKMLNVSERAVSYWETGERECGFAVLKKLVTILNTSADYLIGADKGEKN